LICFVGIDGSGKTTQAQILLKTMREHGVRSKYVWNRFEPCLTKPFMFLGKLFFFRGKGMFQNYKAYSNTKKNVFKSTIIGPFYKYLVLLDYLFQAIIHVSLPLMSGTNVVCDRYVYDVVADLAVDFGYSAKTNRQLDRLLHLLPKPDIVFLIDLPEETSYQRKSDVPSLEYLKERRGIYLAMSNSMIKLDGNKSPTDIQNLVLEKVKGFIR
jgi:thymidylate kinase